MKTFAIKIIPNQGDPARGAVGLRRRLKEAKASRTRHFIQHFFEMCITMCLGQVGLVALIFVEAGVTGFFQLLGQ